MIIKKLVLKNIRSYRDQIVDFPLGKTLFEGDIGSGKSTILMAIEFGLFGLGSEKAGSLLRAGENDGSVSVVFESGGKEYTVQRHLVRKKNAFSQEDCLLKGPEGQKAYSATEIKEKVLDILDFNEPSDPKAQSFIYRYAIYTAQEEMKAILTMRPDHRLQTLRKAFGVEEYKIASENSKTLASDIKLRSAKFASMAEDVKDLRTRIDQLKLSMAERKQKLESLGFEQRQLTEVLQTQKAKLAQLRIEQLKLKGETGKVPALEKLIEEKNGEMRTAKTQLDSNRSKIKLYEPKVAEFAKLVNPTETAPPELKNEIAILEDALRKWRNQETMVEMKFHDYQAILEKGVCPTCDQKIAAGNFTAAVAHKETELAETKQKVHSLDNDLKLKKNLLEAKTQFDQAQARLGDFRRSIAEFEEQIRIWQEKFEEASKTREGATNELAGVHSSVQKLDEVNADLKNLETRIAKSEEDQKRIADEISSGTAHVHDWERQVKDYEDSIEKKLKKKAKSDKLNEYLVWVQDYFLPTLEEVEKQVMVNINQEFDSQFQKWFGMLVDDPGKQAKIDEEFTPIIQQDGLDQEVSYLSGGEKTSVALAYRLALNGIVRKVSTGMNSNLLILDEPTDGFSKEQLSKVREILDEIQSPQIILVSHERELESFADQVIRISKANGESIVSPVH